MRMHCKRMLQRITYSSMVNVQALCIACQVAGRWSGCMQVREDSDELQFKQLHHIAVLLLRSTDERFVCVCPSSSCLRYINI